MRAIAYEIGRSWHVLRSSGVLVTSSMPPARTSANDYEPRSWFDLELLLTAGYSWIWPINHATVFGLFNLKVKCGSFDFHLFCTHAYIMHLRTLLVVDEDKPACAYARSPSSIPTTGIHCYPCRDASQSTDAHTSLERVQGSDEQIDDERTRTFTSLFLALCEILHRPSDPSYQILPCCLIGNVRCTSFAETASQW